MFSELALLGIFCILTEFKNNRLFKRKKDEKNNYDCDGGSFAPVG